MTRDLELEQQMLRDFGRSNLAGKAMFGGWCFLLNGNMLGAAREGRAMYRVGPDAQSRALAHPNTELMQQAGRPMWGYVWLKDEGLADDETRGALARMAMQHVTTLPSKDR